MERTNRSSGRDRAGEGQERFTFEEIEVFELALKIADLADELAGRQVRNRRWLANQLGSASLSILNNTAEGLGEYSPGDKIRFLRYALRSASETAGMIILLSRKGAISPAVERRCRALLLKFMKTATRMILHLQRRRRGPHGNRSGAGER